ncbi:MAG: tetratricopeptide repeat protein [Vicinamibacterales bacterium]
MNEAVKLAPTDPELLYWRGRILEFRAVWGGSSRVDPHAGILAGSNRGAGFDVVTAARLWDPVEDAYRRVLEIDPNAYDAHVHLGYALYWQRRFTDAKAEYELARDRARDPFVIYMANLLLARLHEDQGNIDAAAAAYAGAIAAVPTGQSAYIGFSVLELLRGNSQRARELTAHMTAIPEKERGDDPWWSYHGTRVPSDDLAWLRAAVRR